MGANKRRWLGLPAGLELRVPSEEEMKTVERMFLAEGIKAYKPGEETFGKVVSCNFT